MPVSYKCRDTFSGPSRVSADCVCRHGDDIGGDDGNDGNDNSWGSDAEGDGSISDDDSDAGSEDAKLRLLGLSPNPVNEMALLSFVTSVDEVVTVNVYNNAGVLVTMLFQGQIFANVPMTLEVSANMFETGLYQIQIVSDNGSITTKLMVGS